ncbi:citrate:proton symporter [Acidaminococcus sp. NSJ-142]|jgi:CitMHS family citrate-Mg2+:H+ or citrate-Ca2+:H+ symporter|uniref:CitMHS family transporter n=1 Tax=Acidaminococcus TaxID=904 RepID=UPI001E28C8CC|nr:MULTISPECIES: citrate:proton symporter [Acidaminococcus]MCD2435331.1 citrate:proton symporter [Acidaminococcus hominis]MCH4096701.1 citrate:proton symporter [Acidaminococcus provencensis]
MVALVGYATLIVLVFFLLKGKMAPITVFGTIPIIGALFLGVTPDLLEKWIGSGLNTVWKTAVLFIFSVEFFGIMSDAGVFDAIVKKLVARTGNNVVVTAVVTAMVAVIGHLDGATATTALVTIPSMLPLWKRLNMRPTGMLFIVGTAMGVMNLVPWGGPVVRVAAILNRDVGDLWHYLIPFQGVCLILTFVIAALVGMNEVRHGAGLTKEAAEQAAQVKLSPEEEALRRPKLLVVNIILTIILLVLLLLGVMSPHILFMIALAIGMVINYPDSKTQRKLFRSHAGDALDTSATLLAAAVFIGIMNKSGMLDAMVNTLLWVMPTWMGRYMNIIAGFISVPVGACLGADTFYYGLFPLLGKAGSAFGVPPLDVGVAMLIGKNVAMILSPLQPTTFLALGLAGVELNDHLKANFFRTWLLSFVMCGIAMVMGYMKIY